MEDIKKVLGQMGLGEEDIAPEDSCPCSFESDFEEIYRIATPAIRSHLEAIKGAGSLDELEAVKTDLEERRVNGEFNTNEWQHIVTLYTSARENLKKANA